MNMLVAQMFLFGFITPLVATRERELFDSWQKAQKDVTSLVVEFAYEGIDASFPEVRKGTGIVRILRTATGQIYGSYELLYDSKTKGGAPEDQFTAVLLDGPYAVLDYKTKTVCHGTLDRKELICQLAEYLNPAIILLDRRRMDEKWNLEIAKQDDYYTYTKMTEKKPNDAGWFFVPRRIELAFMKIESINIPKNMPRQIWFEHHGSGIYLYSFTKWRVNPKDPPTIKQFEEYLDRPGWTIIK